VITQSLRDAGRCPEGASAGTLEFSTRQYCETVTQGGGIIMNEERYEKAKKRVEELKKFYGNLVSYALVNVALIIIDLVTSPGKLWFYWVTIFWGIGILFHASKVFVLKGRFLGEEWEQRKIREIMEKEKP
jgi:hypothetical protein